MRPNPEITPPQDDSGRVIYLGDVRRKRRQRDRQAPDRHYLFVLGCAGLGALAVWLAVFLTLRPERLLTYLAFLLPLWVVLTCFGAIGWYVLGQRLLWFQDMGLALRRGSITSTVLVANLAFRAGHRWSILVLAVSVGLGVLADLTWRQKA